MIVLVVLTIVLMVLDKRIAAVDQVRSVLSFVLMPLQYVVSWPIQAIDDIAHNISSRDALVKENLDLKSEQLLLKAQMQRLLAIESENNQLKALMRSSSAIQGKVLIAGLLAIDSDPFVHQVILNKGSLDHVFLGQPVLDANGVLGQVIQINPVTSRVLLINDTRSGVPIQDTRSGVRAIAAGDGLSGKLRLDHVPQTADIKEGDVLVTSGIGERYPEGYPLGKVISVKQDTGFSFAVILVQPFANLDKSRQVLLVWPNKAGTK